MNQKDKDMRLPVWVCGLGVVLIILAVACGVGVFTESVGFLFLVAICLGLGVAAILCWKNQWAVMEDNNTFTYSTMFGRQTRYRFSDIKKIKLSSDSYSLILEDGKVHVESCAIMSDRFRDAIDSVLERMYDLD